MTSSVRLVAAASVLLLGSVLAGCGDDDTATPSGSSTPTTPASTPDSTPDSTPSSTESSTPASPAPAVGPSLDVTVAGDKVDPVGKALKARSGDTLVITITSDRAGELHVHTSPEQELEFEPGTTKLEVELKQPGQVDIEEHASDTLIARVLVK
jgi:hypothetical protein